MYMNIGYFINKYYLTSLFNLHRAYCGDDPAAIIVVQDDAAVLLGPP